MVLLGLSDSLYNLHVFLKYYNMHVFVYLFLIEFKEQEKQIRVEPGWIYFIITVYVINHKESIITI